MDPEEIEQQAGSAPVDQAPTEQQTPTPDETTGGNDAVSLADAMWGADVDKDSTLPDDGETPAATGDETPNGEGETSAETPAETPPEETEPTDEEIEKSLSEKAQHRFRELVNTNKELERRVGGFQEMIVDAQVTPQDVVDLFAYGKAIRTGDFNEARRLLAEQARQLELASGEPIEFGDALGDYPDLQKGVQDLELTRAHALELARTRRANEQQQRANEQRNRQNEQQNASQTAAQEGFSEVVALAQNWGKTDIDWSVKQPMLENRAKLIQQTYPPERWGAMVRIAYDEITATLKAARPATTQRGAPSPLRPNGMGGGAKAPASLHEAMWGEPEQS